MNALQNTNQPHPNQHADPMESIGTSIKTYIVSANLKLMGGQLQCKI